MPASIHNYPARDMMQGRREAGMKVHGSGTAPRPGGGGLAAPLVRKGKYVPAAARDAPMR